MAVDDCNSRFWKNINDIRRHCGMPVVNYPSDPVSEENYGGRQQNWDERQSADERRRVERQIERDRRFYQTINELRQMMGMPPICCPCDPVADGNQEVAPSPPIVAEQAIEDGMSRSKRNQPPLPREDDRDHSEDESQTICDKDFALEIDETEEPTQETEFNLKESKQAPTSLDERLGSGSECNLPQIVQKDDRGQPTVHQENLTENSQVINNIDFSNEILEVRDPTIFWGINIDSKCTNLIKELRTEFDVEASSQKVVKDPKEHPEVISKPLDVSVAVESVRRDELALPELTMVKWEDHRMISVEFLRNSVAQDLFVEMPKGWLLVLASVEGKICMGKQRMLDRNLIFDPGITTLCSEGSECKSLQSNCDYCLWKVQLLHVDAKETWSRVPDFSGNFDGLDCEVCKVGIIDMACLCKVDCNSILGEENSFPFDRGKVTYLSSLWLIFISDLRDICWFGDNLPVCVRG